MAPGQLKLTDPPISALKLDGPAGALGGASDPTSLTNGNLKVELDPVTSLLTATRVSDGAVLLRQTAIAWNDVDTVSAAANFVRHGSKAAVVSFAGVKGEKVYGLGEHKTGTVQHWAPEFGGRIRFPPPEQNELVLSIKTGCADTVPFQPNPNTPF